eukprot:COSAG02_NODE_222_length_28382_cov_82.417601_1_plen_94_part_00
MQLHPEDERAEFVLFVFAAGLTSQFDRGAGGSWVAKAEALDGRGGVFIGEQSARDAASSSRGVAVLPFGELTGLSRRHPFGARSLSQHYAVRT